LGKPYIGVTGFMTPGEVGEVLDALPTYYTHQVMVGVLASDKTLDGLDNKHPRRFPRIERVKDLFPDDERALNLVHFNTHRPERLTDDLIDLTQRYGGPNMHGFQLNVAWPDPKQLLTYKKICQPKRLVLQLGGAAVAEVEGSARKLANRVAQYAYIATDVLLDPSGGVGREFDIARAIEYLRAMRDLGLGLGVAGGLSASNLIRLIEPIAAEFPDISIDAEGKLRDGNDDLDLREARRFVTHAATIFNRLAR